MKAYKGFTKDMTCRGFQYEFGKSYHEDKAELCKTGFHACEYPLDCFNYYEPNNSVYYEVELSGDIDDKNCKQNGDVDYDSKICATDIKIKSKLDAEGLTLTTIEQIEKTGREIRPEHYNGVAVTTDDKSCSISKTLSGMACASGVESVAYTTNETSVSSTTLSKSISHAVGVGSISCATGVRTISNTTGDISVSCTTGELSLSSTTGERNISCATGYKSKSNANGNHAVSCVTGFNGMSDANGINVVSCVTANNGKANAVGYEVCAVATCGNGKSEAKGDKSISCATGTYGSSCVFGSCSASVTTGTRGKAIAGDPNSVAVAWGYEAIAKGVVDSHLVFADWTGGAINPLLPDSWKLNGAVVIRVDGKIIKADTWYTMKNGKVVECE